MKQVKITPMEAERAYRNYLKKHHSNDPFEKWAQVRLDPEEYARIQEEREWKTLPARGDKERLGEGAIHRHNHDLAENEWCGDQQITLVPEEC